MLGDNNNEDGGTKLKRELGLFNGVGIIIGIIVGSYVATAVVGAWAMGEDEVMDYTKLFSGDSLTADELERLHSASERKNDIDPAQLWNLAERLDSKAATMSAWRATIPALSTASAPIEVIN